MTQFVNGHIKIGFLNELLNVCVELLCKYVQIYATVIYMINSMKKCVYVCMFYP